MMINDKLLEIENFETAMGENMQNLEIKREILISKSEQE